MGSGENNGLSTKHTNFGCVGVFIDFLKDGWNMSEIVVLKAACCSPPAVCNWSCSYLRRCLKTHGLRGIHDRKN